MTTRSVVATDRGSFDNRSQAADASGLRAWSASAPGVTRTPQGLIVTPDVQAPRSIPLGTAGNARVRLYARPGVTSAHPSVQVADLTALGLGEVEVGQAVAAGLLARNDAGELAIGPAAIQRGQDLASAEQAKEAKRQTEAAASAAYREASSAIEGGLSAAGLNIQEEVQAYFQTGQVSTNAMTALVKHLGDQGKVTAAIETIERRVTDFVLSEANAVALSMGAGSLDRDAAMGLLTLMEQQPAWPSACIDLLQARPHAMGRLLRQCIDGGQRLLSGPANAVRVERAGSSRHEVRVSR